MAFKINENAKTKSDQLLAKYQDQVFGTPDISQDQAFLKLQSNLEQLEDLCARMDFMVGELKGLVKVRKPF